MITSWIIIIVLLLIMGSGLIHNFNVLFRHQAPFIPSRRRALKAISAELNLQDGQVFFELGAGSAPLLRRLARQYSQVRFVGVEYSLIPWVIGTLLCLPHRNIKIIKQNFWQTDLSQADYIYCFLNVRVMRELENKFKTNCKPGVTIISYIFKLPHIEPSKTLELGHEKIYFYKINNIDNND
jgi:hypothetical protein